MLSLDTSIAQVNEGSKSTGRDSIIPPVARPGLPRTCMLSSLMTNRNMHSIIQFSDKRIAIICTININFAHSFCSPPHFMYWFRCRIVIAQMFPL